MRRFGRGPRRPGLRRPFPPPGRPRRRLRRHLRRAMLRPRRRMLWRGAYVILFLAEAAAAVKLSQADLRRIEADTGQPAEAMSDGDLLAAMERLGIKPLNLEGDDHQVVRSVPKVPANCPNCGRGLTAATVDWTGPLSAACPACGSGIDLEWVELG